MFLFTLLQNLNIPILLIQVFLSLNILKDNEYPCRFPVIAVRQWYICDSGIEKIGGHRFRILAKFHLSYAQYR